MPISTDKKKVYFEKLNNYFDEYQKLFIVGVDNVGSFQLQQVRKALRGHAVVLMGKNTMIRKALRAKIADNANIEKILPLIRENIGFVFSNGDLSEVRKIIETYKVGAAARIGTLAPTTVIVPPGPTGMEPQHTNFFQALRIATKINKGQIEIVSEVRLIEEGQKVTASQAELLQKLDIKPFAYGLKILNVYDNGSLYEPRVLDLTDDDLAGYFAEGLGHVASVSLQLNIPTAAAFPHAVINGFKTVLAVALACEEYSFPLADKVKQALKAPRAAAAPAAAAKADAPSKKEEKKVSSEESDADMGLDLFG